MLPIAVTGFFVSSAPRPSMCATALTATAIGTRLHQLKLSWTICRGLFFT